MSGCSLCMIVRNEDELLSGCLESVRGLVDEIIIVDTGSIDDTIRIADAAGAKTIRHEWKDDFAEARNISIANASQDWILWLDADERLRPEEHDRFRQALNADANAWLVPILNQTPNGAHFSKGHRLFRNYRGIHFAGRIHEQITASLVSAGGKCRTAAFIIDHLGYALAADKLKAKQERNMRLLLAARDANPRDAYVHFTLAQAFLNANDAESAEMELRIALGRETKRRINRPLPADLQASAFNNLADCALRMGETTKALSYVRESNRLIPGQATAHLLAYRAHRAACDDISALNSLEAAAERLQNQASAIEIVVDSAEIEKAITECHLRIARRCAESGDLNGALEHAESADRRLPGQDATEEFLALILLKTGRLDEAATRLANLLVRHPKDLLLRRRLAGVLVKLGRQGDAVALLDNISLAATANEPEND